MKKVLPIGTVLFCTSLISACTVTTGGKKTHYSASDIISGITSIASGEDAEPSDNLVANSDKATEVPKNDIPNNKAVVNTYCGEKTSFTEDISIDVDLAYIRYKRIFGYKTRDEKVRAKGVDPKTAPDIYFMMDQGFLHVQEPTLHFHMKDTVYLNSVKSKGWLNLELEKSNNQTTRVYVKYCLGGSEGFTEQEEIIIKSNIESGYL